MTTVLELDVLRDVRTLEARAARDLADWLAHLELEGKADRTLSEYAKYLVRFLRAFPEKDVDELTDGDISQFLRSLPQGASRKGGRSALNGWFSWLRLTRRVSENPMDFVPKVRHRSQPITRWFSDPDIALLEGLERPDGVLFALMFGTGIRREECRLLKRRHINLDRRHLVVEKGKGGKKRIVPMFADAVSAVADLDLYERLNPDDHLWYAKLGGKRIVRREPISDSTFSRWYTECLERAGVEYLSPHKTRHTYATRMRAGIVNDLGDELRLDLDEIQLLLGHASISTTRDLYVHTRVEDVARRLLEFEGAAS